MYLFCIPKTHSTGYRNYSAVVCTSTSTFKYTKLPLPKISEHGKTEKYQGSLDCGKLDLNSDVNWPDSGKLQKYTTISSQCEKLS